MFVHRQSPQHSCGSVRRATVVVAGLVCLLAALATACGGTSSSGLSSPQTETEQPPPPAPQSSVTPTGPNTSWHVTYSHSWSLDQSAPDGGSWHTRYRFGDLMRGQQVRTAVPYDVLGACHFSVRRDAIVPFELVETNTTRGFSVTTHDSIDTVNQHLESMIDVSPHQLPGTEAFHAAADYSDGPECAQLSDGTDGYGDVINNSAHLDAGHRVALLGIVILDNYRSPAHPGGDPSLLENLWFHSVAGPVHGPNVVHINGFNFDQWYFPADGTSTAECYPYGYNTTGYVKCNGQADLQ